MVTLYSLPSRRSLTLALGLLCLITATHPALATQTPKNIILFIGDGMGVAQVTAAKVVNGKLGLERFPIAGLLSTYSANRLVTESAAGATALATGSKTNNYVLGLDPQGKRLESVLDLAQQRGMATGVISTARITHATPAAFFGHVPHRDQEGKIAEQLAASHIDVFIGGGLGYFLPKSQAGSLRKDNKRLLHHLRTQNYKVITSVEDLRRQTKTPGKYRLAALLAKDHMPRVEQRKITLSEMTQIALHWLNREPRQGFFLMVEGAQIDWGGHDNDSKRIIHETIDFDRATATGLDYAQRSGDTLVLVTADHESGGYTLLDGSVKDKKISRSDFVTKHHTAEMVPLFAYGPGSHVFGGIHDNTFLGQTLKQYVQESPAKK